jgi:hypothetical protein
MCRLRAGCLFYTDAQRFGAWRSGGFLAQKFNRRTALEPTTKLSYEALNPPLRQTAVGNWCLFISLTFHRLYKIFFK